jgi:hypothetical protein
MILHACMAFLKTCTAFGARYPESAGRGLGNGLYAVIDYLLFWFLASIMVHFSSSIWLAAIIETWLLDAMMQPFFISNQVSYALCVISQFFWHDRGVARNSDDCIIHCSLDVTPLVVSSAFGWVLAPQNVFFPRFP